MYENLTLLCCSYNQPTHLQRMLQSFVQLHGDEKFNILISENSPNEDIAIFLNENLIPYIRNHKGTHSKSIDPLLVECKTKYGLLVDSDVIFKHKIDKLLEVMATNTAAIMGEIQGDRGGYRLHPRIAPWFCLIDVEQIKSKKIKFHDQTRIEKTNSTYFYKAVPLNPFINNTTPFYDVGATFYEDINKCGMKILNAKGISKYFTHYEGASWRRASGHEGYITLGNNVYQQFLSDTAYLKDVVLKGKFNVL